MITTRLSVILLISLLSISDISVADPGAQRGTKRKAQEISQEHFPVSSLPLDVKAEMAFHPFEKMVKQEETIGQLKRDIAYFAVQNSRFNHIVKSSEGQKLITDQIRVILRGLQQPVNQFFKTSTAFKEGRLKVFPNVSEYGVDTIVQPYDAPLITAVINETTKLNNNLEEGFRLVQLLVANDALLNRGDYLGMTPLAMAVVKDNISIAYYLIIHRADVNKAMKRGTTPLIIAADAGYKDIVIMLLNNGADVSRVCGPSADSQGKIALDLAQQRLNNIQRLQKSHRNIPIQIYNDAVDIVKILKQKMNQ